MTDPTVRNVAAASNGGTATPHSLTKPTTVNGDVLVAVFEYATGAATNHITATGWAELAWRDQVAATGRSDLAVMGRIADGTEGSTVAFAVAGTINHVHGQMLSVQNHGLASIADVVVGTPTGGAAGGASPQTNTVPGITVPSHSLILIIGGTARDANSTAEFSNFTNANLSGIAEQMDDLVNTGNGGGFGAASGICAGTTTGDSTYRQATLEAWNAVHIGIKPGPTVVSVAQATETDLTQPVTPLRTKATTQATSTEVAQAVAAGRIHALVQAQEVGTAQIVTPFSEPGQNISVGQAVETDAAQTVTSGRAIATGQASESDSGLGLVSLKARAVVQATETDVAVGFTVSKVAAVGTASESDEAQGLAAEHRATLGQAQETNEAQPVAAPGRIGVLQAEETNTAQVIAPLRTVLLGAALESDQAQGVTQAGSIGTGIFKGPARARVQVGHNEVT